MIFRKFREGFKKSAKYCLLSNWHDFLHEFIILGQIPVPQSRGGGILRVKWATVHFLVI